MYHHRKINVTPKGVYLPISKLHSILAAANLLAHNNMSQICYCGQISLQSAAINCIFFWQSVTFGGNIYFACDGTFADPVSSPNIHFEEFKMQVILNASH